MTNRFVFLLGIMLYATQTMAQSTTASIPRRPFYLNSVVGFAVPDFANVNSELQKAGYLPLDKLYFVRGAGFYTIFPKLRLASIFNFSSFSAQTTMQTQSNWVRATSYGTSLGFVVKSDTKIQLIPYAGITYCLLGVRVSGASPANSFGGYLAGPSNQHQMALNQFMAGFGLHIAKSQLGNGTLGQKIAVGLRTGYTIPLGNANWKTDNVTLTGGPTANPGGFYTHLIIGISQ